MTTDVVVIGGGIVGLATAFQILEQQPNKKIVVLEKESRIASHQTGHNSGVIHSGLYYKPGSLKARNCIDGYHKMLAFCLQEKIAHDVCGKVVVATTAEELPRLEALYQRGIANGLSGVRYLAASEIREIEPHCVGLRGLFVPQTGIVDYIAVAGAYAQKISDLGGEIRFNEEVLNIVNQGSTSVIETESGTFESRIVVACAGLYSDRLARMSEPELPLQIFPFRGEYFKLVEEASSLVKNLIYPVPDPNFPFLGVHFTRMIGGGVECGPNAVLAFAREGYKKSTIKPGELLEIIRWPGFRRVAKKYWKTGLGEYYRSYSKSAFVRALQRLVPEIENQHLVPSDSGVRAQACDLEGNLLDDFDIRVSGRVIHVCNAPSPAATASLAIGATIAERVLNLDK